MSVPCIGPCSPYATVDDLCAPCSDIPYPDEFVDTALAMASDILYFATGQQFPGTCREIVRPCTPSFCGSYSYGVPYRLAHLSPGGPCSCDDQPSCGCTPFRQIELGFHPISTIQEVRVCGPSNPDWAADGSGTCVLSSDLYHIDEFHWLVRDDNPDGTNPGWPHCSNMSPSTTADDVFSVDFTYGQPVPAILTRATAILACELIIGCNPEAFDEALCRLPRNVVSVARQGVSIVLQSAFFTPRPGQPVQFGIPEIDMAITSLNPYGLKAPMVILSPDDDDVARRVGT